MVADMRLGLTRGSGALPRINRSRLREFWRGGEKIFPEPAIIPSTRGDFPSAAGNPAAAPPCERPTLLITMSNHRPTHSHSSSLLAKSGVDETTIQSGVLNAHGNATAYVMKLQEKQRGFLTRFFTERGLSTALQDQKMAMVEDVGKAQRQLFKLATDTKLEMAHNVCLAMTRELMVGNQERFTTLVMEREENLRKNVQARRDTFLEDMDAAYTKAEKFAHRPFLADQDRKADGTLFQSLPKAGRKQRSHRCGTRRGHRLKLAPEQDIEKRPAVINERRRMGDIEIDLIIGAAQEGVILVMTDRLSLHTQLASLPGKDADTVAAKIKELLRGQEVFSLTFDRGLEWARHAELEKELGVEVYFCKPYHSWEKGTVENTNGRIRRFLPKWESFPHEEMDHEWLREREEGMNNCPRKALGYYTPLEVKELWGKSVAVA
jgi:transposase, IS30 family